MPHLLSFRPRYFLPRVTRVTRVARGICVVRLHSGHSNCKITLKFQNVRFNLNSLHSGGFIKLQSRLVQVGSI